MIKKDKSKSLQRRTAFIDSEKKFNIKWNYLVYKLGGREKKMENKILVTLERVQGPKNG